MKTSAKPRQTGTVPSMQSPHYPLRAPSLASTMRQACVHSFIAILVVFVMTVLWAATFGELPTSVKPAQRCVQFDLGPALSAERLHR